VIATKLDIPELSQLSIQAANFFGAGRTPCLLQISGKTLNCRPCLFVAAFSDAVIVSGRLGSLPFVADVERADVDKVLARADRALSLADLSAENAALMLEFALEDVLASIEAKAGQSIELDRVEPAPAARLQANYGFECSLDAFGPIRVAISGHADVINRLHALARELRPDYARVASLHQRVSFRCGHASLSLQALKELVPGDGIVLTRAQLAPDEAVAIMAGNLMSICQLTQSGQSLTGRFLPARNRMLGDFLMNNEVMGQPPGQMKGDALRQLSDLPVKVVFELGHMDVPLYELANAGAGYVFVLPTPVGQGCAIMSGGAVIGRGEVVKVGEQFAVRVTNLAAK
jgi:type III secretion protein Q